MKTQSIIGVVGGVGPSAGLDLVKQILSQTNASTDQDHLDVILASLPGQIEDRSKYLLGESDINPAYKVINIIKKLNKAGANIIGIPCNTMHSSKIFNLIQEKLKKHHASIILVSMIEEVIRFIVKTYPTKHKIGLVSTMGTYKSNVYQEHFEKMKLYPVLPDDDLKTKIHQAIYHPVYGIKANSHSTPESKSILTNAFEHLYHKKAQLIILGCTEIAMVQQQGHYKTCQLINPTQILARALIRHSHPEKLKTSSTR